MNIGPFYFESKDILLALGAVLLGLAMYFKWDIWMYSRVSLFTLALILLITRALVRSTDTQVFFYHVLVTIVLALFLPFFHVLLFYVIGLALMKLFRAI